MSNENGRFADADHQIPHSDEAPLVVNRLVRSRRKTVSLIVAEAADLVVRAPLQMPMRDIEQVVRQKGPWIRRHQSLMRQRLAQRPQRRYEAGEGFLWLGRTLRLDVRDDVRHVVREDGLLIVPAAEAEAQQRHIDRWYREEARRVITERVRLWAALMDLTADRISVTGAVKRWGSCSGRANLSFAARLVMAPLEVVDYVVVHELAHVLHKNHGPHFWELVGSQIPDYALHRRWLAEHAHGMIT